MEKTAFALAVLVGIVFTNTCCTITQNQATNLPRNEYVNSSGSTYGSYLAGRVAHLRHDLNAAADYYMLAEKNAPDNQMLSSQLYIMLTSQGRVEEAAIYADKALQHNDGSLMIYSIKSVYEIKQGNYEKAIEYIDKGKNPFADILLTPMLKAWSYAGLDKYDTAIRTLAPLSKNQQSIPIYLLHAGMISDYMNKIDDADKYYSKLMSIRGMQLSIFPIQVISNFYQRQNNPEKVKKVLNMVENPLAVDTKNIIENIKNKKAPAAPILTSPSIGAAEVLFDIAMILRGDEEVSLLFASLASYANPDYDLPQMLCGDILESKELFSEANEVYRRITPNRNSYYSAQMKIVYNLIRLKKYNEAEKILRTISKNYKPNAEIYSNLGEVMQMTRRYRDAAIYYKKALEYYIPSQRKERWSLLIMLSMVYDAMHDANNAEKYLREAIEIASDSLTQNHLGYILIRDNRNIEEAFQYIVNAYNLSPHEGGIVDSLGWAFYQIGRYDEAVKYLEKASEISPSESVIYSHLGDAYWEVGRKSEAVFQWNHALQKEDISGEINKEDLMHKIKHGKEKHTPAEFDEKKINEIISSLEKTSKNKVNHNIKKAK